MEDDPVGRSRWGLCQTAKPEYKSELYEMIHPSPFKIHKITRFEMENLSIPAQHRPGQSAAGALWSLGQETQAKDILL